MTQELYINGKRCDLYDKEPIPLIFDSPFFTDINKIVSNRTYAIKIPKTPNNLKIIEFSHRTDHDNKFPYKRHIADYYLNGMEIIRDGSTILWSIAEDIEIQLIWGNISAFKELTDINSLRDLFPVSKDFDPDTPTYNSPGLYWNEKSAIWTGDDPMQKPKDYLFSKIDYGMGTDKIKYLRPVVNAGWILDRLAEKKNLEFRMGTKTREAIDNLVFPLCSRIASADTWRSNPATASFKALTTMNNTTGSMYLDMANTSVNSDTGKFEIENVSSPNVTYSYRYFKAAEDMECKIQGNIQFFKEFRIDQSGNNEPNFTSFWFDVLVADTVVQRQRSVDSPEGGRTQVATLTPATYKVLKNQTVKFRIEFSGLKDFKIPYFTQGDFNICQITKEVPFNTFYPIYPNLPDMAPAAFLKLLMQITGVFPYVKDKHSNVIHFTSIDTLYDNVKNNCAVDWTNKVLMHSRYSNDPSQMEFKYGSYARNNRCLWKDDKKVEVDASGYLTVESDHLEKEKDLLKLELSATDMKDGVAFIPLFTQESDGSVKENDVKPRVLVHGIERSSNNQLQSCSYFQKLEVISEPFLQLCFRGKYGILEKYYSKYQNIIRTPKVINIKCLLNEYDLSILDLTVPVYFEQFGQYYVILKIQSNNGVSDCELLEID